MRPNRLEIMALAIMRFEGYYGGSVSYKNNNPGNLKFAQQYGAISNEYGDAVFSDFRLGWEALIKQLFLAAIGKSKAYKANMTLTEFFAKYAKDHEGYADFVAYELRMPVTTKLKDLL